MNTTMTRSRSRSSGRADRRLPPLAIALIGLGSLGCGDADAAGGGEPDTVVRESAGPAKLPPARRLRRLTAEQFHRSLEVATGESWSRYEQFAGALGRPDYAEVTDEGLEISVTFDKLVHDAARETCGRAVASEVNESDPLEKAILREVTIGSRELDDLRRNLRYLHLRFLGVDVPEDDPRFDPYLDLLTNPPAVGASAMAARWTAVCVALVTHPDFLTY